MIEAMPKRGNHVSTARALCDECAREETIHCDYRRKSDGSFDPDEGQAIRKLTGMGWEVVKGKMLCPTCTARRKAEAAAKRAEREKAPKAAEPPAPGPDLRHPTREQKRQIIDLLEEVYDVEGGHYKGAETDASVAEALGDGVMPGWVAALREDLFGPDGGNVDMAALAAEIADWLASGDKYMEDLAKRQAKVTADWQRMQAEVRDMAARLERIRRAVGPKAVRL